jgi:glycerate 2-kinase
VTSAELLRHLFLEGLRAVDPMQTVPRYLPKPPPAGGRTVVIGAGKAAARMALAVETHWVGALEGLVVTRYGHSEPCKRIRVLEAAHPVPDAAGVSAATEMMQMVGQLTARDLVICLISGGGSALLTLPAPGIPLDEVQRISKALLACGATISEMNCVRRHLSAIKGGKLGAACGAARVVTLIVSDVPNDDPAVVASGPTLADASHSSDALLILERYNITICSAVASYLSRNIEHVEASAQGVREHHVIATAQLALAAAAQAALAHGITPVVLGGSMEGEARDAALFHAGVARQVFKFGQPAQKPAVILSGGETTVTVRGTGRGGRNAEFLLALAQASADLPTLHALACDTDGIDGVEDNAGAVMNPSTLARASALGLDVRDHLQRNDAYTFFKALDDLVITGPTRTNVNDFRALLIL